MTQRRFVLEPLAEIAAHLVHPTTGASVDSLLDGLPKGDFISPGPAPPTIPNRRPG